MTVPQGKFTFFRGYLLELLTNDGAGSLCRQK